MIGSNRYTWRLLLIPLSWLYGVLVWVRNYLFDQGVLISKSFRIPIISVGNISVGGTGKTPHVEYLLELLSGDLRVATLSRGYKRKTRDYRIAGINSNATEIGDEPLQIKKRFPETVVAVDRKRVNGVRMLLKHEPAVDVILLDDAYQHRSLKPGFSVLLIPYDHPNDKDHLLPAGNLREPARNRNRANIILITRSPERMKPIERREIVNNMNLSIGQHLYFTSISYGELVPVYEKASQRDTEWFRKNAGGVLIVTGIAFPRPIRQYARRISTNLKEISFPDHHTFSTKDMDRISSTYHSLKDEWNELLILTTEKDAMRFREHHVSDEIRDAMRSVRIHVKFLNEDQANFDQQIRNYVSSNKRSSILYQDKD
jgi:tetraacyldisaccharide 4'-kinase